MDLETYSAGVRAQLTAAAALGDESTRAVAEALATAADPAVRLALLEAISAAADEITAALLDAPSSPAVAVRLDRDEVRVEVRLADPPPAPVVPAVDEGDNEARISLRLPESVKSQIETAARAEGVSVNSWLVRAATSALTPGPPFRASGHGGRITGWING
ncbi:MAG TPA: Arc family DNA-binding protein [Sporichthya sp.]|nr:Arc family DNA-binding protein [Sporichthya sp.]